MPPAAPPSDEYDSPFEEEDNEFAEELADILSSLRRLRHMIVAAPWFHHIGQPLGGETRAIADAYVSALGFPDAHVAQVPDWEHAAIAAENPDINSEGWEAEEQLRIHLSGQAADIFGEAELHGALEAITEIAGETLFAAVGDAASMWGVQDEAIIEAAAGQAIQACYNAALVLAACEEEDHPFALMFQLYESGHWPIGLAGRTYNIF